MDRDRRRQLAGSHVPVCHGEYFSRRNSPEPALPDSTFSIIPPEHRKAVRAACHATFSGVPVEAITMLSGGRSGALVYRLQVEGTSYLLRVIASPNALNNPVRQFAAMQVAARDGIAPHVLHADPAAGVVITDFIDAVPWHTIFADHPTAIAELGALVRKLHDGPSLPAFLDAFECIDGGLAGLARAGTVLPPLMQRYLVRFAEVQHVLVPHMVLVACHNDLNPGNLLHDGERFWIVDWESAWQNDPLFDVATLIHWFGLSGEREATLLDGYFGRAPRPLESAKLELMRQVTSCYYSVVMLLLVLRQGEPPPALDLDIEQLPTFAETRVQLREGKLALTSPEDHVRFALVLIRDAMERMALPAFGEAIQMLGQTAGRTDNTEPYRRINAASFAR